MLFLNPLFGTSEMEKCNKMFWKDMYYRNVI